MKEASGELSMTVVTIIAIIAIATIVGWLAPKVGDYIETKWGQLESSDPVINQQ